jgi:hypothetical protein
MSNKPEDTAFQSKAFPCNSLPFLNRAIEILKDNKVNNPENLDYIEQIKYRANLLVIVQQCHGQLARLDSMDEYQHLSKAMENIKLIK